MRNPDAKSIKNWWKVTMKWILFPWSETVRLENENYKIYWKA